MPFLSYYRSDRSSRGQNASLWNATFKGSIFCKTYGIYFIVNVHGEARKFSFIPLLLNLGAGLALLSITTVICDIIVLHLHKNRVYYQDKKYLTVEGLDAWRGFGADNPNYVRSQDQIINSPDGNT